MKRFRQTFYIQKVTAKMIAQRGHGIKVSEIPDGGTWPKYPPSRRRASRDAPKKLYFVGDLAEGHREAERVREVVRRLEWEKRNVSAFIESMIRPME